MIHLHNQIINAQLPVTPAPGTGDVLMVAFKVILQVDLIWLLSAIDCFRIWCYSSLTVL